MFNTSPLPSLFLPHCVLFLTDLHLNTARSAWYLPPPASTFRFYPREMGVFRKHLNSCLTSFMAVRVGQGLFLSILICCWLNWSAVSREENGVNQLSINVTSPYAPRHYDPSTKSDINVHTCRCSITHLLCDLVASLLSPGAETMHVIPSSNN